MEINGKVHCFFEQSGTFKNEFIKLGIPAEDYDIQNNFGETDHVVDLFDHIEREYDKTRQDKTRQDKILVIGSLNPTKDCQDRVRVFSNEGLCPAIRATDYKDPPKIVTDR